MMFVSVGGQKPFPRLCHAAATLAEILNIDCFIQTAEPGRSYGTAQVTDFMSAAHFQDQLERSTLFVSHAGMGNILAARSSRRDILMMPRRVALGEHRNDHQVGTATALQGLSSIYVAWDDQELIAIGKRLMEASTQSSASSFELPPNTRSLPAELTGILQRISQRS